MEPMGTFSNVGKRQKDRKVQKVIEMLSKDNPILDHAPVIECNNGTTHRSTVRTGLPKSYWAMVGEPVPDSTDDTAQLTEDTGTMEQWLSVPKNLLKIQTDPETYLLSRNKASIEGLRQDMAENLFYGSRKGNPASFNGLHYRFNTLDEDEAETANNIIDMGGTGNRLTSIWLATWDPETMHLLYPAGSTGGIQFETFPQHVSETDKGNLIKHKTHYMWDMGLAVVDWRYQVRIANIDSQNLDALINNGAGTPADWKLIRAMVAGRRKTPRAKIGKQIWYMNRDTKTMIDLIAAEKSNVYLKITEFEGKPVTFFQGIPIEECDAIVNTEEQVI